MVTGTRLNVTLFCYTCWIPEPKITIQPDGGLYKTPKDVADVSRDRYCRVPFLIQQMLVTFTQNASSFDHSNKNWQTVRKTKLNM